jgi:uncharacterized Fe-S cluster-containing radical SAM superfamily protein
MITTLQETTAITLYDPVFLSKKTESNVIRGNKRKYLRFGTTPDYGTGIATAYTVGCNLRCLFCGSHDTRDKNDLVQDFYSPEDVFEILLDIISENPKINKLRLSDGEPTLGFEHLIELLELNEKSETNLVFVVETNGIMLGFDEQLAQEISRFKKTYIRVSLKAGNPEAFSLKTGAVQESFFLPFQAIKYLKRYGANFGVSAMSRDPRFMDPLERISLMSHLGIIDPELVLKLEEEVIYLFPTALRRIKAAGWKINGSKIPFYMRGPLKKYLHYSYNSFRSLQNSRLSLRYTIKNFIQLHHGI